MASLYIQHIQDNTHSDIDYSLKDGRVRSFVLHGEKLYDEADKTNIPGWVKKLCDLVVKMKWHQDNEGHGLHAFIYWLIEKDYLKKEN